MRKAPFEIVHEWEEPDELLTLLNTLREQRPDADTERIRMAFYVAEHAHAGQTRTSGEPYITHPLAVATILLTLPVDDDTIIAAFLHDVLEDTAAYTREQLAEYFGNEVLALVEGVTKLRLKTAPDLSERQKAAAKQASAAESLRKMLLAMANDVRVIIIKLADRLHNMQTLSSLSPEKQHRIARETLDIYAPLAARLGIWQLKWQLEDLAFKYLHPQEFADISAMVGRARREREKLVSEMVVTLKEGLHARGLKNFEIQGRPKHLYSIHNKMKEQGLRFDEIYDLIALRIICEQETDCYIALGLVHALWPPLQGMFTDYIATPKPNGYQSIHTKVYGPHREPIEVQIRTKVMHRIAEFGVAAHWTYKEGTETQANKEVDRLGKLRQQLFDWSGDNIGSSDFLRSVSTDLFSEQVFVMTPMGEVLDLPKDSTPVDFAFRIHTEIGLTLVGAKVNGSMVPLSSILNNGDVVELITRQNATPSLDWLEFVKSSHARNKLRNYFRKQSKFADAQRGKDMLERELKLLKLDPKDWLTQDKLMSVLPAFDGGESHIDIFAKVGSGLISAHNVIQKLRGNTQETPVVDEIQVTKTREGRLQLAIGGIEDIVIRRAKCCDPIPGDELVGYVTRGRGMMIHRKVCPNALHFQLNEPERLTRLDWPASDQVYGVTVKIVSVNRQGLLMDISTIFGESHTNVSAAKIRTLPNHTAEIEVEIEVKSTDHLQYVTARISNFSDIISINRAFGRSAKK
jgi:guanosine-3',5'-bis(diphosphate) 3'-pyrophosphohydrolase